jgi:hypothetical protein
MLRVGLLTLTLGIAQNCGAWKLVAMALNKAQGFGYPFKKDGKHTQITPKQDTQHNQPPKKKNQKIKIIYLGYYIYGLKNNSSSLTSRVQKKEKEGKNRKKGSSYPLYTLEDWKFREITISLDIAGLQKLRIIIVHGQLQHIFVQ